VILGGKTGMIKESLIPFFFENCLIISLDAEWIKVFDKIPEFEVGIDDERRLHLISKQKIKKLQFPSSQLKRIPGETKE
jgi:hypothetical protein